jgi:anti-sigma regulatory factor (Ser/Thr protein kinase)
MVEWSFDSHDAEAARRARLDFARHVSRYYGEAADTAAAELVLGELIGNVVRYAPGPTHVNADFDRRGVTIAVKDAGSGFSRPVTRRENDILRESGRGLAIVASLVQSIEVDCIDDEGCCVRARLDVVGRN